METTLNLTTISEYKEFAKTLSEELNISYNKTLDKIATSLGCPGGWNEFLPVLESNLKKQYKYCMEEPEDIYNMLQEKSSFKIDDTKIIKKANKMFKLKKVEQIMGGELFLLKAWISEYSDYGVVDIFLPIKNNLFLRNIDAEIFKNHFNDYSLQARFGEKDMDPKFYNIIQEKILEPVSKKIVKPITENVFGVGIIYEIWTPHFKEHRLLSLKIVMPEEFSKYEMLPDLFLNKNYLNI